jgi:hypothetical protein
MVTFNNKSVYAVEKLFDARLMHKGFLLPVTVYLVEETFDSFYHHCVCFENTRFEQHLEIALDLDGSWFDLSDRDDTLAGAIGCMIDAQMETIANTLV